MKPPTTKKQRDARDKKVVKWSKTLTQREIGKRLGVSFQRVQQLMKQLNLPTRVRVPVVHSFVCKNCKKAFSSKLKNRTHCSRECVHEASKVHRSATEQKAFLAKLREKGRIRANNYYHQVLKKRNDWRQIIRERNKKYYPKRYAK